jgi:hypothetical protein
MSNRLVRLHTFDLSDPQVAKLIEDLKKALEHGGDTTSIEYSEECVTESKVEVTY